MKKMELIFEEEKVGKLKAFAQNHNLTVMFSELMLYEPGKEYVKKYRDAKYMVDQVKKIRAEIFLEEEQYPEIKEYVLTHLLEKEKNDKCVIYDLNSLL